jgi:purine-binding chemotaxis protein CheW
MSDLLIFNLAGQQYALPVRHVREVVPRASVTQLPGAPKALVGMLRLRGALLPVVDLRTNLGLPAASPRIGQCIIVTRAAQAGVGLLVDGVEGLVADAPMEPDATARRGAGQLVRHVQEADGRVVTILDVDAAVGRSVTAYLAAIAADAGEDAITARHGRARSGKRP